MVAKKCLFFSLLYISYPGLVINSLVELEYVKAWSCNSSKESLLINVPICVFALFSEGFFFLKVERKLCLVWRCFDKVDVFSLANYRVLVGLFLERCPNLWFFAGQCRTNYLKNQTKCSFYFFRKTHFFGKLQVLFCFSKHKQKPRFRFKPVYKP
jgi:hypothetical protein